LDVQSNLLQVQRRIENAKKNAQNPKRDILLVGVTKGVEVSRIEEAVQAGLKTVGENRIQEAQQKKSSLGSSLRWDLVGHLQRNKVKEAIKLFHLIHSLDSLRLAEAIEKEASLLKKKIPMLLQVNLQKKETQFGVHEEDVQAVLKKVSNLPHLAVKGLMMIAPFVEDPEEARPYFRRCFQLKESLRKEGYDMETLSMGMSNDFEIAIEEGANAVRIGRAIFGGGPKK